MARIAAQLTARAARLLADSAGELVKLAQVRAAEESVPFSRRKAQHRAVREAAVADRNVATRVARDLHAVAVGITQGALHPGQAGLWPFGRVVERGACHGTP